MPLNLPNVTLWACCWSETRHMYSRTIAVLRYCQRHIKFERVVLFAYLPVTDDFGGEVLQIPRLDMSQWNIFVNRTVPIMIPRGKYLMSVHEDGFPIDMSQWRDEFLDYDYIGAPWADGVVGNGGFNIESRRMLDAKLKLPPSVASKEWVRHYRDVTGLPHPTSDVYVCRLHRDALEAQGIRFAPRDVAMQFSTEQMGHQWPSFGFHGRTGIPNKYWQAWNKLMCDL